MADDVVALLRERKISHAAPIRAKGMLKGIILLGTRIDSGEISTFDQEMLQSILDLAGIVIVDLVPLLELTDEQAVALEPVLGSAMRGLIGVVVEYGDQKMNTRTKIKVAKSLKKIKGSLDAGLADVLTPEQLQKYQAHKEAQKAAAG